MKKTILLLLLLTVSVLNFGQDNSEIPKDGTYYTYYLNNGEKISCNEKDIDFKTEKVKGEEIFFSIVKTPKGVKKLSAKDLKYETFKTYLGHKLIAKGMSFIKKVDGIEDDYWHVKLKTKEYWLAAVHQSSSEHTKEGHYGSTIMLSRALNYCVFDKNKNVIKIINNEKDFKKCLEEYFPELENFSKYFESINYKYDDFHWGIVEIAGDILAHKYYKDTPVLDNAYYDLKKEKGFKKKIEEVQAFAPQDSNTTTE